MGCKHRASEGVFYIGGRDCVLCLLIEPVTFGRCAFIIASEASFLVSSIMDFLYNNYIHIIIINPFFFFFFLIAQVMLITHDRCMIDEIRVIW